MKAYDAITKKEPNNGQAWYRLGYAFHASGQFAKAAAAYQKAIVLNSNHLVAKYNLACAYARMNDKDKAFEVLAALMSTGFFQVQQLTADEDLSGLREDARFKEILAQAKKSTQPCKASPEYRQFDFWIGEWEVQSNSQPAGKSSVQLILGDCVIFENWTGAFGMNGKSFSLT